MSSQGLTWWQWIKKEINFAYNPAVERYPRKPDHLFPDLELFIYSPSDPVDLMVTFDKTSPENFDKYTAELNKRFTIFYTHGFIDTTGLENPLGKVENTSAAMIFAPYWQRVLFSNIFIKEGKTPPENWFINFIVVDWSEYNSDYGKSLANMPLIANIKYHCRQTVFDVAELRRST